MFSTIDRRANMILINGKWPLNWELGAITGEGLQLYSPCKTDIHMQRMCIHYMYMIFTCREYEYIIYVYEYKVYAVNGKRLFQTRQENPKGSGTQFVSITREVCCA